MNKNTKFDEVKVLKDHAKIYTYYQYLPLELQKNHGLIKSLLNKNPGGLKFIPKECIEDINLDSCIREALVKCPTNILHGSERIKSDKAFISKLANSKNTNIFNFFFENFNWLQDSMDKVLVFIEQNNNGYNVLSDKWRVEKKVLLKALKNGNKIKTIPDLLANDEAFIFETAKIYPEIISKRNIILNNNINLFELVIKKDPLLIYYFSDEIKNNDSLMLKYMKDYPNLVFYASDKLKNNKDLVLNAFKEGTVYNTESFIQLSKELKGDIDIAFEAVMLLPSNIKRISPVLLQNKDFLKKVIKGNNKVLAHRESFINFNDDFDFMIFCLNHDAKKSIKKNDLGSSLQKLVTWNDDIHDVFSKLRDKNLIVQDLDILVDKKLLKRKI